ncbi:MAG: hypothetical protein DLM69_03170 [Candidatus Chloroheliales bacterium]|nr:MAG: hypothetical protein DLM69_03170 [Chloroflexota bacterium]
MSEPVNPRDELANTIAAYIRRGEQIPYGHLSRLFPEAVMLKDEYELVYRDKLPIGEVFRRTLAAPLQRVRDLPESGPDSLTPDWRNMLIFGDNLQALKTLTISDIPGNLVGQVRLIYIDPPFSTRQDFKGNQEQQAYQDKVAGAQFIEFLRQRLIFLRRLLTNDGSIYVHLDSRMNAPTKLILDEIFGRQNFVNEIIWRRAAAHNDAGKYGVIHDTILYYAMSAARVWRPQRAAVDEEYKSIFLDHVDELTGKRYARIDLTAAGKVATGESGKPWRGIDPGSKGRHWAYNIEQLEKYDAEGKIHWPKKGVPRLKRFEDEFDGTVLQDLWTDIRPIHNQSSERTGYPTQKPEALLERIILASSNENDIVLDAFAGSGTTAAVAERLGRCWVAIDCGKFAIYTIQQRLLHGLKGGLTPRPFTLYNAGLYDYQTLKGMPFADYTRFVLQLFQAREGVRRYGHIETQGLLGNDPVFVYNFTTHPDAEFTLGTLHSLYEVSDGEFPSRVYIIAPGSLVAFLQNREEYKGTTFVMLKVPNSVIERIKLGVFQPLKQSRDVSAVNDPTSATGFDFIRPPRVRARYGKRAGNTLYSQQEYTVQITRFESAAEEGSGKANGSNGAAGDFPTFALLLVDPDYRGGPFRLGHSFDAVQMKKQGYTATFSAAGVGDELMLIYIDIYGNELIEKLPRAEFEGENRGEEDRSTDA